MVCFATLDPHNKAPRGRPSCRRGERSAAHQPVTLGARHQVLQLSACRRLVGGLNSSAPLGLEPAKLAHKNTALKAATLGAWHQVLQLLARRDW